MPPAVLLAGAGAGDNTALWSVGPLALSPSLHCSHVAVCHFYWVTQLGHISPFGTLSWCLCPLPAPWLQHRFLFHWWALTSPSWVGRWCGCTYPTSYTLLFWMWVAWVSRTLLVLFWVIFGGWCSSAVLWLATLCLGAPLVPVPWWEAFGWCWVSIQYLWSLMYRPVHHWLTTPLLWAAWAAGSQATTSCPSVIGEQAQHSGCQC